MFVLNAMEPEEAPSSSNIASNEIDEETTRKLRGDAIGETMYSEVFVVKTLMQFSDLQWSEDVENDLCFLWDMTEEQDVCRYLFQMSYPSLACSALENHAEPRFVEIVVGIFANILCSECEKPVKRAEVEAVLNLLSSDDPYILIQVMRFVHAVSFIFDKLPFVKEEHMNRCSFILENSTNKELLATGLRAVAALTDDLKLNEDVVKGELLVAAITALNVCKEDVICEAECDIFEEPDQQINMKHVVKVGCNLCGYVDNLKLARVADELAPNLSKFTTEIGLLFEYFSLKKTLLPADELFVFYMEAVTYICKILKVGYISIIVVPLCQVLSVVIKCKEQEKYLKVCGELLGYFLSLGCPSCLEDMRKIPQQEIKAVLSAIERCNFTYDFVYLDNLRSILCLL